MLKLVRRKNIYNDVNDGEGGGDDGGSGGVNGGGGSIIIMKQRRRTFPDIPSLCDVIICPVTSLLAAMTST